MSILLEVWEDLVCPWCYLGRVRLTRAIAAFEHPSAVTVRSRAFELAPRLPVGAQRSVVDWLAGWGLNQTQIEHKLSSATAAAADDGLQLSLATAIAANTFAGHRLVELGWCQGGPPLQEAVLQRLFSAHFVESMAIDDPATLVRLGAEAGLDANGVAGFLAGEELADEVRQSQLRATELGISSVPCFVADRRLAVAGAQSSDTLLALLRRAYADSVGSVSVEG